MNILVLAPHPDDEVLGAGGTIARHVADGDEVHVVILTRGNPEIFSEASIQQVQAVGHQNRRLALVLVPLLHALQMTKMLCMVAEL